jgi:beta-mannosidase
LSFVKTIWSITHTGFGTYQQDNGQNLDWRHVALPCSVQNSPFGLPSDELYRSERVNEVEWMRPRVWLYRTRLPAVSVGLDEEAVYQFLGIDYACQIFLNGAKVLEHEGMFSVVEVPLPNPAEGDELLVAILPFAEDRASPENAKARCTTGNGWDFAPKIQSAGIWDEAELLIRKRLRVTGAYVRTDLANAQRADVIVYITLSEKASGLVTVELDGVRRVCPLVDADQLAVPLNIASPTLWWPNGLGQPALVELTVTLDGTGRETEPFRQ